MKKSLLFLLAFHFVISISAQRERTLLKDSLAIAHTLLNDVSNMYSQLEQSVELQFAKLKKENKSSIDELQAKISQIDQQISQLKLQSQKIQKIAEQMEKLLPQIDAQLNSRIPEERTRAQSRRDSLFFSQQKSKSQLEQIDNQINSLQKDKQNYINQIKILDANAVQLDKDKLMALTEIKKNRDKSIADVNKAGCNQSPSPKQCEEQIRQAVMQQLTSLQNTINSMLVKYN